jgi:hypothetical protein
VADLLAAIVFGRCDSFPIGRKSSESGQFPKNRYFPTRFDQTNDFEALNSNSFQTQSMGKTARASSAAACTVFSGVSNCVTNTCTPSRKAADMVRSVGASRASAPPASAIQPPEVVAIAEVRKAFPLQPLAEAVESAEGHVLLVDCAAWTAASLFRARF